MSFANELYNSALTVNVSLNNKIFKIDLTRKEQVLQLLKSFDVNARVDGKNKNTINVYNYKTKTPVKYEYKRSIKIYDVLTKSGFIYAKTGSACYTEVSKNNYVATVKNIFTHHLNLSDTEIYTKMKEFSIDNILFMGAINNLRFDELYILYIFQNYNENDLKKLFLDMNYDIFFYEEAKESFDSLHVGYVFESLYGTNLETFIAMRSKLVSRYLNYSATLTIDNVLYGYGHPLPPTSQIPETPETEKTSFIAVKFNGTDIVFDMFKRADLINFLTLYDDGTFNSIFNINTINIYNYKTKKPTTFTYKKGMSFEEILKKAGFENGNTGAACYTKINDTNYIVNAKNIYAHHLNMNEIEIFHKMNVFSVSDIMFLSGVNYWGLSRINAVYTLYIYKNYELAEAENKLRELDFDEDYLVLITKQYTSSLMNINLAQLMVEEQYKFEQMRNQLVTMYVAQAVSLMVDRVMYGPGYVPEAEPPKVENPPVDGAKKVEVFQKRINDFREKMPTSDLRKYGNAATADVEITGLKTEFNAHSKINSITSKGAEAGDFSFQKSEADRIFKSYVDTPSKLGTTPYSRFHDTEAKILEDIASQIKDNTVKGTIDLYTELPPCQSCTNIILEFRKMFSNIKLNIFTK